MANDKRLAEKARRSEERGELERAIAFYKEILADQEESGSLDPSLYNRVGDLYLKNGDRGSAVRCFERAVDYYESHQLFTNAIALCKKILRNAPDHTETYRQAGRLLTQAGLLAEARSSYIEYANRMERDGSMDRAIQALREFAELSGDEEIRLALADRSLVADRTEEALEQLRLVLEERERRGEDATEVRERIQQIDPRLDSGDETTPEPESEEGGPSEPEAVSRAPSEAELRDVLVEAERDLATEPPEAAELPDADQESAPAGRAARYDPEPGSTGDPDVSVLAGELQDVLNRLEGEEKLRQALPVIDQLLQFEPEKVTLLQRKLGYALALGKESAAIEAYLALGSVLASELTQFSLRFLTTSSDSGVVTTAVKVEERSASGPVD